MTTHTIECKHDTGMAFNIEIAGHTIKIDASENSGGNNQGPTPKPLLLAALAGCTAIDVISMLNKMRAKYSQFYITTSAELNEHTPKTYDSMHLIYNIKIEEADKDKMEKAVNLSVEKYCGVHHMLEKAMPVTHEIRYL